MAPNQNLVTTYLLNGISSRHIKPTQTPEVSDIKPSWNQGRFWELRRLELPFAPASGLSPIASPKTGVERYSRLSPTSGLLGWFLGGQFCWVKRAEIGKRLGCLVGSFMPRCSIATALANAQNRSKYIKLACYGIDSLQQVLHYVTCTVSFGGVWMLTHVMTWQHQCVCRVSQYLQFSP